MSQRRRYIAHLDMDAFFASVELLRFPQLEGQPVVIGGRTADRSFLERRQTAPADISLADFPRLTDYVGRGVITTATYAARQYGVGSAMGMMKAARLCPQAILLPIDFDAYRHYSQRFKAIIRSHAPVMEDRGIDEVYIDLTDLPGVADDGGLRVATTLKDDIRSATGLSCSIGIAPNKLIAKMASDFDKPGGITRVNPQDLAERIWPLACRLVNGIGPKTDQRLRQSGITTIGELAAAPPHWLVSEFGESYGAWLHEAAHGRDERALTTHREAVSLSRETTFERDLHAVSDKRQLGEIFTNLCERLAADLQRKRCRARSISVKLRYADFSIITRAQSTAVATDDAREIRHLAGLALKRAPLEKPLRLLGVRAASLLRADAEPAEGEVRNLELPYE